MIIFSLFQRCRNRFRRKSTLALCATLASVLGCSVSHAQLVVIVDSGTVLGTAASWTPVGVPTSSNSAVWNSTSTATTGANTIATTLTVGNIDITNVPRDVTISGGSLVLGNANFAGTTVLQSLPVANATGTSTGVTGNVLIFTGNTIDMSLATGNLTIASPLTLVGPQVWSTYSVYNTTQTIIPGVPDYVFDPSSTIATKFISLNITAPITGSQGFTETGNGTINLDASSPNLTGQIQVFSGNLSINAQDAFGPNVAVGTPASLSAQLVIYPTAAVSGTPPGVLVASGGNIGTTLPSLNINTPVLLTDNLLPLGVVNSLIYNFVGPGIINLNAPVIISANVDLNTH